jgi:hypothetical protein
VYCCAGAQARKNPPRAKDVAMIARKAMNLFDSSLTFIATHFFREQMEIEQELGCRRAQS